MMNIILLIFMLNTQAGRLYLILKETYLKEILPQKTATKLIREWVDLHVSELEEDWKLARESQELKKIKPLT